MPADPDIPIDCPLWHLLNKVDVSIANAEEEEETILDDARSAMARGLDAESYCAASHRKHVEIQAMHRVRAWIVECAERGELTLDEPTPLHMLHG